MTATYYVMLLQMELGINVYRSTYKMFYVEFHISYIHSQVKSLLIWTPLAGFSAAARRLALTCAKIDDGECNRHTQRVCHDLHVQQDMRRCRVTAKHRSLSLPFPFPFPYHCKRSWPTALAVWQQQMYATSCASYLYC